VLELARATFGIDDRDGDQAARDKIAGRILLLDRELESALPLFFDFLGVPDPERPAPRLDPEVRQRRLFDALRRLTRARSRREPSTPRATPSSGTSRTPSRAAARSCS
jgi:adenylate cyclase